VANKTPSPELPPLPEPHKMFTERCGLYVYLSDQMRSYAASAVAAAQIHTDELERICAEVYQVVGILADEAGRFNDPEVTKVLDNLSQQRLVHRAILPFSCLQAEPTEWRDAVLDALAATGSDMPADTPPRDIIAAVIRTHVDIALDPAVSDQAALQAPEKGTK
jgi:hypothetical protein